MEKELNKLSLIARETDNMVALIYSDKTIEWVNAGFTKITHLLPETIEYARITDVFSGSEEMIRRMEETIDSVLESKVTQYAEFEFVRPDQSSFWINVNFTPILIDGIVSSIICIGRDSTQTKQVESQLKLYSDRLEVLHKLDHKLFSAETLEELFEEPRRYTSS
jgi:PAS domain S-box-containing protein